MRQPTIKAPDTMPATPIPETARPRIRANELGAAPHTTEPTSNNSSDAKNTHFTSNSAYSLPNSSWKQHVAMRYDDGYQAMSSSELNSAVILGTAVETMERSWQVVPLLATAAISDNRGRSRHAYQTGAEHGEEQPKEDGGQTKAVRIVGVFPILLGVLGWLVCRGNVCFFRCALWCCV